MIKSREEEAEETDESDDSEDFAKYPRTLHKPMLQYTNIPIHYYTDILASCPMEHASPSTS